MNGCHFLIDEIEPWSDSYKNITAVSINPRRTTICADCVGLTRYFEFCPICQGVLQRTFGTADDSVVETDDNDKLLKPEPVVMKSKRRWASMSVRRQRRPRREQKS